MPVLPEVALAALDTASGGAIVAVPPGSRARHAVLLALHGWGDSPEWECEAWGALVERRFFVLCPRGALAAGGGYTWRSAAHLAEAVDASLAALGAAFPEHVDAVRPLLTGFSLGAVWGRELLARDPTRFSAVVFVEGGYEQAPFASPAAARERSLPRLLYACGQWACTEKARRLAGRLGAWADVDVVSRPVGHTYGGELFAAVRRAWPWLVAGDARFAL
ncbi:MAG: hypothetical protein IT376_03310 [Polyangiaceae bacterium]|nr:hypothetical protein [Polyangiaceae bacterium]